MYGEFASDAKIQMLSEVDQRRFVMLLCLRCNGYVTLQDEEVTFQLRISNVDWKETKANFIAKNLIDEFNSPTKWDERQFVSDSSAARVRRHREKAKQVCNVTVTPQIQNRTEQNRTEISDKKQSDIGDAEAKIENPNKQQPCPYEKIAELWNSKMPELPAVEKLHDTRKKHLGARWRENPEMQSMDSWSKFFDVVRESNFLMGKSNPMNGHSKPFRVNFDWVINPQNFVKIYEGNYHS